MKDSEFIELLNLYLDHEIDPADAVRLELEVQRDAGRRQIYRQYCQMQKACSQLADRFADTSETERSVEVFSPTRISRPTWYAGGLAAAACLSVFLIVRSHRASAPAIDTTPMVVAVQEPARPELTSVATFTTVPLKLDLKSTQLASTSSQLAWMKSVQFSPVNMDLNAAHFDVKAGSTSVHPALVAPQISQEPLERVAFTLQR